MRFLLRGLLLLAVVALVAANVDIRSLSGHFRTELLWMGLAVQPILLLGLVIGAARLRVLIALPKPSLLISFKAILITYGLNVALPARLSELLKITFLYDHARVPLSTVLAAVFLERVSDVLLLGILTAAAVAVLTVDLGYVVPLVGVAIWGTVLFLPHAEKPLTMLARRIPWRISAQLGERLLAETATVVRSGAFLRAQLLGPLIWALGYASVLLFLQLAASVPLDPTAAFAVFIAGVVGGAIPALPAGLGTYEAAVVFALRHYGVAFEEALSLALALHAIQIVLPLTGALVIVATERIGVTAAARRVAELLKSGS